MTDRLFGNSRFVHCQRCGRGYLERTGHECPKLRLVPTTEQRAEWFRQQRTDVAQQVGRGTPAPFAPVRAVLYASALAGLVMIAATFEGAVAVVDAVRARRMS